jgi:hypothetical protein
VTKRQKKLVLESGFKEFSFVFGICVSNYATGNGLFLRPFGHPQSLLFNKCILIILK